MNVNETLTLLEWFKKLLLDIEAFFHSIQEWFEGGTWPGRVVASLIDAIPEKTGTDA
jgi:hypothetical protein